MFERVVENWLSRVNEREYQFPFCELLISKGFRVLHVSAHGPAEQGKDVIAVDPAARPVAFQLKTGNIDLAYFRKIYPEIRELIEIPINYPGIPPDGRHRCVLVTNGTLADTVRQQIIDLNRKWAERDEPELEVMVKGDLLREFLSLHTAFFPIKPADVDELLKLYVQDGSSPLPHQEFSKFLVRNLIFGGLVDQPERLGAGRSRRIAKLQGPAIGRNLASTSLLVSYVLRPFVERGNFWPVFEAWIMFGAHTLAVAERLDLAEPLWKEAFDLSFLAARAALETLSEECLGRDELLEGDVLVDSAVYRARITKLAGLMAAYHIICRLRKEENRYAEAIRKFISQHKAKLHLWGESAIPYLLLVGWYLEDMGAGAEAEALWGSVTKAIATSNKFGRDRTAERIALPDPYLECEEALARLMGISEEQPLQRINYAGQAYSLRSLVYLLARRWRRRLISSLWYDITDVNFVEIYPVPSWGILLWRFPKGDLRITPPKRPQSWAALLQEASNVDVAALPQRLIARPDFLAAFLCVYPHRVRGDTVKILDDSL